MFEVHPAIRAGRSEGGSAGARARRGRRAGGRVLVGGAGAPGGEQLIVSTWAPAPKQMAT